MPSSNKLVIVDTNCLVRVYFSALRPLLGCCASGYELKTLSDLADELKSLATRNDFAWLTDPIILAEVDKAVVRLSHLQKSNIRQDAAGIRKHGDSELEKYRIQQGLVAPRSLSTKDSRALAAALELTAALSTDEWPLRYVADFYDYDNGSPVELLSSVELIELLEREGLLTREDRIRVYADWLRNNQNLLRGSEQLYLELFGEAPPTAQD